MEATFGPASVDDVAAIVALLADDQLGAGREGSDLAPYLAAFEAIEANPNQLLVVGRIESEVVATLQLAFLPGLSHQGTIRCDLEAARMASHLRGKGLGKDMVRWAIDEARQRGCGVIQLASSSGRTDAHRFYAQLGFEPSHTGMKLWLSDD